MKFSVDKHLIMNNQSNSVGKCVVMITGTNGVGKTTLAKKLIELNGGIKSFKDNITYCGRVSFAGKFTETYGGVDFLRETKCLANIAEHAFIESDVFVCEGSYLHTFGINLTNLLFVGDLNLVVNLSTDVKTLVKRILNRTWKIDKKKLAYIVEKQSQTIISAKKFSSIGVPVKFFDTNKTTTEDIAKEIMDFIVERVYKKNN